MLLRAVPLAAGLAALLAASLMAEPAEAGRWRPWRPGPVYPGPYAYPYPYPPPVYAPVVVAPPPVYAPVVAAPPPVVYAAPPVVYPAPPVPAGPPVSAVPAPLPAAAGGLPGAPPAPGESCLLVREYTTEIVVGGETVEGYGYACLQPDGSWLRGAPAPAAVR